MQAIVINCLLSTATNRTAVGPRVVEIEKVAPYSAITLLVHRLKRGAANASRNRLPFICLNGECDLTSNRGIFFRPYERDGPVHFSRSKKLRQAIPVQTCCLFSLQPVFVSEQNFAVRHLKTCSIECNKRRGHQTKHCGDRESHPLQRYRHYVSAPVEMRSCKHLLLPPGVHLSQSRK